MRPKKKVAIAQHYLRPEMLNPWKGISKKKGGTSSSGPAMPERPPPLAFVLFMCDFRKSKEFESVVTKAAEDKWDLMSEAEKSPYEKKALETSAAYDRAAEFYKMMMNVPKSTTGGPMM